MRQLAFAAAALLATAGPAAAQTFDATLKPVRDAAGEVTAIEVRSTLDGMPAEAGPFSLAAPVVYAALRGVADRVTDLEVRDAQGVVPLTASDDPPAPGGFPYFRHWKAERPVSYPVTISYASKVQPAGSPNGPPFGIRPAAGGVSGAGSGFLVIPEHVKAGTSTVRWDLSGFAPGAAGITSFGEGQFTVQGPPSRLMQGWYMAGPLNRHPASGDADGYSGAWLGKAPFDVAREMAWAADVYAYLDRSFGYLPAPRYRVFMRFLDTPPFGGATALTQSFMLSRSSGPLDPKAEGPRRTLVHEMTHQWTGGIEAPQGVSSWFSEGLTTFYTALLPMRGGFTSIEEYGAEIDEMARGYWGSPARDWSADRIAHAGFGDESIRHVPYNRSSLYFASLDARIRAKSDGRRKLDDMLKPMFVSRKQGVRFDHESWKAMLGRELGPAAVAEWERVILGGEMFTPESNAFGPCFRRTPKTYTVENKPVEGYAWVRVPSVPDATCRTW